MVSVLTQTVVVSGLMVMGAYESAPYEVVEEKDGYEIRQYDDMIIAEATVTNSFRGALNDGFRAVGGYIFGDNETGEEIAMTTPVFHHAAGDAAEGNEERPYTIAFVMPAEYAMDDLPQPENSLVEVKEMPGERFAALRFSGFGTERAFTRKIDQLQQKLEADGVRFDPVPLLAQYNPPWTLPMFRRNEVLFRLTEAEAETPVAEETTTK